MYQRTKRLPCIDLGGAGGQEKRRYELLMEPVTPQRRRPRERGVSTVEIFGAKDVVNSHSFKVACSYKSVSLQWMCHRMILCFIAPFGRHSRAHTKSIRSRAYTRKNTYRLFALNSSISFYYIPANGLPVKSWTRKSRSPKTHRCARLQATTTALHSRDSHAQVSPVMIQ